MTISCGTEIIKECLGWPASSQSCTGVCVDSVDATILKGTGPGRKHRKKWHCMQEQFVAFVGAVSMKTHPRYKHLKDNFRRRPSKGRSDGECLVLPRYLLSK